MCLEHGVLEAVCTKCNPKLIPIFQAKGDWCAEHEFPESICPICHPGRGGRPGMDVSSENEPPADGTKIIFRTLETARQAGIETVKATTGTSEGEVAATAMLTADASRVARVNARAPGVVRAIRADLGVTVDRGAPLAVIESAELARSQGELQAARGRLEVAEAAFEREQGLLEKGITSAREVQAARQELEAARAEVASGEAMLEMVGAGGGGSGSYTLRSPISGTVTARSINVGTLVQGEEMLFEIVDVSRLWAEIDIPERDAQGVRLGQAATIEVDGLEGEFHGTVDFLSPVIDPATRTVRARAALDNRAGLLRANMYARARIAAGGGATAVIVPRAAVQEARGTNLVFVRLAEDEFETRRVSVTPVGEEFFALARGVSPGEDVVTTGSFLLKTETLKESIGAGCCEIEPPK